MYGAHTRSIRPCQPVNEWCMNLLLFFARGSVVSAFCLRGWLRRTNPPPVDCLLDRFGVPAGMLAVIRQFQDGMRECIMCVPLDDGECPDMSSIKYRDAIPG